MTFISPEDTARNIEKFEDYVCEVLEPVEGETLIFHVNSLFASEALNESVPQSVFLVKYLSQKNDVIIWSDRWREKTKVFYRLTGISPEEIFIFDRDHGNDILEEYVQAVTSLNGPTRLRAFAEISESALNKFPLLARVSETPWEIALRLHGAVFSPEGLLEVPTQQTEAMSRSERKMHARLNIQDFPTFESNPHSAGDVWAKVLKSFPIFTVFLNRVPVFVNPPKATREVFRKFGGQLPVLPTGRRLVSALDRSNTKGAAYKLVRELATAFELE